MKKFPQPETYELFFKFMPWGKTIKKLLLLIEKEVTENSNVLDVMCGPGVGAITFLPTHSSIPEQFFRSV
jgi:hypothetical protein